MSITREQIIAAIRARGVRAGDLMIAHSSYKSLGSFEGGPEGVAIAMIDAVSPGGSVFIPTFNFGELAFDPASTPSLTGAITETFRKLPGVVRSDHPTHSVSGFGPEAAEILQHHPPLNVFGVGTPLWKLWQRNAWVLLVGCDHRANSMIHVAEELAGVPYVKRTRVGRIIRDGGEVQIEVRRPGCSENFNVVDQPMRAGDHVTDGTVGSSRLMLMKSSDLVRVTAQLLRNDPAGLLCPARCCKVCDEAREVIATNSPAG
jgi:aminoglycoside 3-N-acetyltransferase